jgi:hypothetical protein
MKFSEIKQLFDDYDSALYSDAFNETRYGCDCGCGGDSYDSEDWDEMVEKADAAIEAMKKWCADNNIEYDGIGVNNE